MWEYWQVEIAEAPDRAVVMKQALDEAAKYDYELVSVTPIVDSRWDVSMIESGVRIGTRAYLLTFKRQKPSG